MQFCMVRNTWTNPIPWALALVFSGAWNLVKMSSQKLGKWGLNWLEEKVGKCELSISAIQKISPNPCEWKVFDVAILAFLSPSMQSITWYQRVYLFPPSELWTKVWLLWHNGQISHCFPESQGQRLSDPHSWAACSGVKGFCCVARVIKRMNSLLSVVPANICGIRLALFTFNSRSRWKVAVKCTWAFQDSYLPLVWVRVCVNC